MSHSHTSDSSNSTMEMVDMVPWLHFSGGDNLFFKSWHPSSSGAIAGACIGLVLFAMFERWIAAIRGVMEAHWKRQALALMSNKAASNRGACTSESKGKTTDVQEVDIDSLPSQESENRSRVSNPRSARVIPPFIPSHDLTRGVVFALQALLMYVLMLAVMTFQAAYFISIIAGLGVGEMLFGRLGSAHVH
ncbi:unnamed protein product [Somion occarium]|uniref:Copper transport protein n=1 Tax=Somion occarium TaxID=3059160 RepID=A0ABP1CLI6_9APHY